MNISIFNYQTLSLTNEFSPLTERKKTLFSGSIENQNNISLRKNSSLDKSTLGTIEKGNTEEKTVYKHFAFVDEIKEFNRFDKSRLMEIIEEISRKPYHSSGGHDTDALFLAQTKFELEQLAEKMIPEKYQEQMQQAIQIYMEDISENHIKSQISAYESFYKLALTKPFLTSLKTGVEKNLQQLEDGTHRMYAANKLYTDLFKQLKTVKESNFIHEYEKILDTFLVEQKNFYGEFWNKNHEAETKQIQEKMRMKWNTLATHFSQFASHRLSTTASPLINAKI